VEDLMRQSGCSLVHNRHFWRGHLVGSLEDFLGGAEIEDVVDAVDVVAVVDVELEGVEEVEVEREAGMAEVEVEVEIEVVMPVDEVVVLIVEEEDTVGASK
jgi:hypothetical protein